MNLCRAVYGTSLHNLPNWKAAHQPCLLLSDKIWDVWRAEFPFEIWWNSVRSLLRVSPRQIQFSLWNRGAHLHLSSLAAFSFKVSLPARQWDILFHYKWEWFLHKSHKWHKFTHCVTGTTLLLPWCSWKCQLDNLHLSDWRIRSVLIIFCELFHVEENNQSYAKTIWANCWNLNEKRSYLTRIHCGNENP